MVATPAQARVLSASKDDPPERPSDPGRDIQSITSSYDPAGTWVVKARSDAHLDAAPARGPVVTLLVADAGNQAHLHAKATLRYRR